MGYSFGRLLRVNLSTGKIASENIPATAVENYLGGRALGAWLLYHELGSGVDPLSPANKLIFVTGPLVGTTAPSSNRFVVLTKSPQTGLYLMSISGGDFGAALRRCGCDVLVIEGAAAAPVYLKLSDDGAELLPADSLWGLGTSECEAKLKKEAGIARSGVASIGPAGENGVVYAGILSAARAAGRGGAGAVMGSKKLKAVLAAGSQAVEVSDASAFRDALSVAHQELKANKFTADTFARLGSGSMVNFTNALGIMPHRNWQEVRVSAAERIAGEALRENNLVKDHGCSPPCVVQCAKIYRAGGRYAGYESDGPDYETIYSFGSACGIYERDFIIAADKVCDELGLDTISTGLSIAFAMECFERGLLTAADTGGLELKFGNHQAAFALLSQIARREGFGAFLALGTKGMAAELGEEASSFAMHCKGMELGAYDPRSIVAMALVFACGPRGGCHHAGGFPVFAEILGKKDLLGREGKAETVKLTRDKRISFSDSTMLCTFTSVGLSDQTIARLVSAATGRDLEPAWFYALGDRTSTVERAFNVREGLKPEDDTLPRRLLTELVPGGKPVDLGPLRDEFYTLCGWDPVTGAPLPAKMREAGLIS